MFVNAGLRDRVRYVLRVLQVVSTHDDGTPDVVRLVRDTDTVNLKGGEEFYTCYVDGTVENDP